MKSLLFAGILAASLANMPAMALDVVSAPVVTNSGLTSQTDAFTAATGTKVAVRSIELLKVPDTAKSTPTDVVFAIPDLLEGMKADIAPGSIARIGRVHIVLAVRAGAPHPDISTVAKLAAALKSTRALVYSNPDPARGSLVAQMIDKMLKRPEFAGVNKVISTKGDGTGVINGATGLMNNEGDMALQFESEILIHKELEVVSILPDELGGYVDISAAIMAKAADPAQAKAYVAYITSPDAVRIWKAHGLYPAQ